MAPPLQEDPTASLSGRMIYLMSLTGVVTACAATRAPPASPPAKAEIAEPMPSSDASETVAAPPARVGSASVDESSHAHFTCAMHPQVKTVEVGTCPICGMDLVPMQSATGGED